MESVEQRHPVVLVVDDDDAIQRSLGGLLRRHGFAPVRAMTIAAAVTAAEEQPLDAVILDLSLKGRESGLDFLAWLRQRPQYRGVPILILTGQTELGEARRGIDPASSRVRVLQATTHSCPRGVIEASGRRERTRCDDLLSVSEAYADGSEANARSCPG